MLRVSCSYTKPASYKYPLVILVSSAAGTLPDNVELYRCFPRLDADIANVIAHINFGSAKQVLRALPYHRGRNTSSSEVCRPSQPSVRGGGWRIVTAGEGKVQLSEQACWCCCCGMKEALGLAHL